MKLFIWFILSTYFMVIISSESISSKKCREYRHSPHSRNCHHKFNPLLGYRPAKEREFPHTALLGMEKNITGGYHYLEWVCTGVLISHDFVLALAECGFAFSMKEATHVRLGDFNYGSDREHYKPMNVKVAQVILHPDYNKKFFYNNIALVHLDQSLDFTEHIRPACLPQVSDVVDESVSMTGWPFKLYNVPRSMRHKQDMTLRKYDMNAIDETECKQIFTAHSVDGMPNGITDTQICAAIMEDDDRHFKILRPLEILDGAPLQTLMDRERCMYGILGLSHFKPTFGLMKVPLVFTRIYPYLSWIEQIVWRSH